MEDFKIDIMIGEGPAARSIKLDLPPFTLIGATTRAGLLTSPLRDRFGIVQRLEYYSIEDLTHIVQRSAHLLAVEADPHSAAGWLGIGAMMASESSVLTPRVRRELPASFLGRMLKTWWMPGPATGVVFAVINAVVIGGLSVQLLEWLEASGRLSRWASTSLPLWRNFCWAALGYLALLLVLIRLLVAWLRRFTETQPAIGLAVLVILSAVMCLLPYGLELHWNDYRDFPYSWWQITNWPWTLRTIVDQTPGFGALPTVVAGAGGTVFLLHLLLLGRPVLPQRLATPQRVQEAMRQ
jgi:hypothetical protein